MIKKIKPINVFEPYVSNGAIRKVVKVLKSKKLSAGQYVCEFENAFSQYCNSKFAIATNSCTSALHLSLLAAGVGYGDEVITTPITFVATGLSILYTGAKVVFADIEPTTGNIDVKSIAKNISKKTKAILIVDYAGYPCDIQSIFELSKTEKIILIEDAAHSLGAEYNGKKIGEISDFTCFSFQSIKHITSGDGGMITFNNKTQYDEIMARRRFGIINLTNNSYHNDIHLLGFKYSMNEIAAAIGLEHLKNVDYRISRRRIFANLYRKELIGNSDVELLDEKEDRLSSFFFYPILIEKRNDFINALKSRNINIGLWHQRIDKYKIFEQNKRDLTGVDYFDSRQVSLPIHDSLTLKELKYMINCIKLGW